MSTAVDLAQSGLQGWRAKLADRIAGPVSDRTPLDEDGVKAVVGAVFFALSVMYVVKTAKTAKQQLSG